MNFKKKIKIAFTFIAGFLLLFLLFVFYVMHDESPMKESFTMNTSFVEIETDCFDYCFTEKDRYFLKNELKVLDKDTIRLMAEFHGIKSVIGVVKYEESKYVDFLNGYDRTGYYIVLGKHFFGPFREVNAVY
ncbi:hypothetical protein [Fibrobacter succinogenes]|uniref:Uncharacterized protein n=1 Tax=Fibrobacter succinogenes TaxID=833 RepID=A0A380RUU4_FIBSU|nr:hypothetical protein [Fibrobacter succinogenes]PWJ36822.1 hypothetical protein IE02_0297 [Fibrobacter succinogenes subsp. elongatus]SUQ19071.1 hypothetical protein SAMN05661053_0297 [Fibrobacter succinogenes]